MFGEEQKRQFRKALEQFALHNNEDARDAVATILAQAACSLGEQGASPLERLVRRRCPAIPGETVEDIVQETIVHAIEPERLRRLWENYRDEADPEIYLCTVLRGRISKALDARKRAAQRETPLETELGLEPEAEEDEWDVPAPTHPALALNSYARTQLYQIIKQCLNNDLDWQILYLRAVEGLDLKQVAQLLCISHDNARQRFGYLMEKLRECPELVQFCQRNKV
ncbi:MAG: sigma-70 family RNA polymerase sigma factor [Armatimonadetes bacterium]|nr:sigma-70 family RNA polymerase sigma factor [Armatimonadota bacterium]GBC90718.1 hypothetical protein HRbin14_01468 [bacterium HR14]